MLGNSLEFLLEFSICFGKSCGCLLYSEMQIPVFWICRQFLHFNSNNAEAETVTDVKYNS